MAFLPTVSGQQAAVLGQSRRLFHPIPDPGSIVEPVRGGQQSAWLWLGPLDRGRMEAAYGPARDSGLSETTPLD